MKIHIIIEGPSGSGKTTISNELLKHFEKNNNNAILIPEFSDSDLGEKLKSYSQFSEKVSHIKNLTSETFLYFSDKLFQYENYLINSKKNDIIISDRFFTTQSILGVFNNDKFLDNLTNSIVYTLSNWFNLKLSYRTVYIFLFGRIEILASRLSLRIGRELTDKEYHNLEFQIKAYKSFFEAYKTEFSFEFDNSSEEKNLLLKKILECF
jgi:thymidylate kinase